MTKPEEERTHFNENDPEAIGAEMRRRREVDGVARAKLAGILGIDARTLARWEIGGSSLENLRMVTQALSRLRLSMAGKEEPLKLEQVSTLELALELTSRARIMEARDRKILDLKRNLVDAELGYLWPEGL